MHLSTTLTSLLTLLTFTNAAPQITGGFGCVAKILDFDGDVIGEGCVPKGGEIAITGVEGPYRSSINVKASDKCGVSPSGQVLPVDRNWSLQSGGENCRLQIG